MESASFVNHTRIVFFVEGTLFVNHTCILFRKDGTSLVNHTGSGPQMYKNYSRLGVGAPASWHITSAVSHERYIFIKQLGLFGRLTIGAVVITKSRFI